MTDKPRRSTINWRDSKRLRERLTPLMHDYEGDVDAYLTGIINLASDILIDMGITPKVPLDIDDRLKYFDREKFEEPADGYVAVRLLENATSVRDLLKIETPTANQLQISVRLMAEIADLLHMADVTVVQHLLSTPDNKGRDAEIRQRRRNGETLKSIRKNMNLELSDKQLARIAPKRPR